jgi:hypothetical protein
VRRGARRPRPRLHAPLVRLEIIALLSVVGPRQRAGLLVASKAIRRPATHASTC